MTDSHNDGIIAELEAAVEKIEASRGKSFVDRFIALGLDPKTQFAGHDWRNCDFSKADLQGCDFRNTRLYRANFKHAQVAGADFRGAGDVHTANMHLSNGWREGKFEQYQLILIEAQLARMRAFQEENQQLLRDQMDEKEWFYQIKACPTFMEAKAMLDQMEAAGHPLNQFAYSYVLDRAKRDYQRESGWKLYEQFRENGGTCDEVLITAAMGVSPDSRSALDLFNNLHNEMNARREIPGERAYNMVISEQDDNWREALDLFRQMKADKVRVSRYTIFALFDACESFANAVTVLMEAKRSKINIGDAEFVSELADLTRYPEMADWNIALWREQGFNDNVVIWKLVWNLLGDPFRKDALLTLGFPNKAPPDAPV